jgi:predicted metal-dependent hydrolase
MVSGETHYVFGRRYRLRVTEVDAPPQVTLLGTSRLLLQIRPDTSIEKREAILSRWYRNQLEAIVSPLIAEWIPAVGVQLDTWGIRRMKTRWGTCNIDARRIWLNLELAKKPRHCLIYILVHELVHLLERHHNDRFRELMDRFLPQWRIYRDELNQAPLAHEDWSY